MDLIMRTMDYTVSIIGSYIMIHMIIRAVAVWKEMEKNKEDDEEIS